MSEGDLHRPRHGHRRLRLTRPSAVRNRLLAVLVLLALAAGPLGPAPEASAAWAVPGGGVVSARAAHMPAGDASAPTVTVFGVYPAARTFTVTRATARPFGGRPATGYVLTRNATLSDAAMDSGTRKAPSSTGSRGSTCPLTPARPLRRAPTARR